ncbi:MAG: hypothetical protein ACLVKO_04600 [Dysgonomonas sp.]
MIEPRGNSISVAMGTVSYNNIRNSNNQQTILKSRKLASRAIEKMPQQQVNYFRKTRFKTENLYGFTPVVIECNYIAPSAYNYVYYIEPINSEKCRISYGETESTPPFTMEVNYGQFVQESRFFIKINKTERFTPNFRPFNFRFVSKEELVNYYSNRVNTNPLAEGSSALTVSIVGNNSNQDVEFLDVLLDEFRDNNLELKNEASDNTIRFIDHQLGIITDSLNISESTFKDFQDRTGIYSIESETSREKLNETLSALGELKAKENAVLILTDTINNTILNNEELVDPGTLGIALQQGNTVNLSEYVKEYNKIVRILQDMGRANPLYEQNEKNLIKLKINILEGLRTVQGQIQAQKEAWNRSLTT